MPSPHRKFRPAVACLLLWTLFGSSIALPAEAPPQPGTLATIEPRPAALYEISATAHQQLAIAALPQSNVPANGGPGQTPNLSGASASKTRRPPAWMWAVLVGGAAAAAGIAVALGTKGASKTATIVPTATIGPGTGTVAGAP